VKALIPVQITFTARVFLYRILVKISPTNVKFTQEKIKFPDFLVGKMPQFVGKKHQGHLFAPPPPPL
jgi:hypothetical protein